jgi:hypothetical protein
VKEEIFISEPNTYYNQKTKWSFVLLFYYFIINKLCY